MALWHIVQPMISSGVSLSATGAWTRGIITLKLVSKMNLALQIFSSSFFHFHPLSPTSIPFPPKKSYLSYLSGVAGEHQVQPTLRWKQFVILQVFCFIYFEFIHHIKYLPQGMSLVATIYMASAVEPPITVFVQTAPTTTSYLFTFSE